MNNSSMQKVNKHYIIGVMKTPVEELTTADFFEMVDSAVKSVEDILGQDINLKIHMFDFTGPHLTAVAGGYSALDFLQLGMNEKLERKLHFLLIITEVDLLASTQSYVLALPSQLTNVGILSTRRLSPDFWGETPDAKVAGERLTYLMLHTIGHLLNLGHHSDPENIMYDFTEIEELNRMKEFNREQIARMVRNLPHEAHERIGRGNRSAFTIRQIFRNLGRISQAVVRANPFTLMARMPTMFTTALSVIVVLFFSAETWDVGSTMEFYQLMIFSFISLIAATFVLYKAFALRAILSRSKMLAESTVVTQAATFLSIVITMFLYYFIFLLITYLATVTIFPRRLMETWPTLDPAVRPLDHVKLSMFNAAFGVLAGSLGGRADSKDVIRHVLFINEES